MKKIVRLTESELKNIVENSVKRAIKEGAVEEGWGKNLALGGALGLGAAGVLGTENPISDRFDQQFADQEEVGRAFPEDRAEYGDELNPQGKLPADTIGWEEANGRFESRIAKAVMESIQNLMKESGVDKLADRQKSFGRLAHLDVDTKDDDDQKEALKMRKSYIKNQRKGV